MRLRQVSLFIAFTSVGAIAAMLVPPERINWKQIASFVMSPAVAGDIEDRMNFFLTQHQDKVKRASVQRAPVSHDTTASLSFRVFGSPATKTRTAKASSGRPGHGKPLDETPTLRQYPVASIYEDQTLRYGDYVVMPSGVKIFRGRIKASHRARDFVPVRMSQVPKRERAIIARAGGYGSMIIIVAKPKPAQQLASALAPRVPGIPRLAEQTSGPRLIIIN